MITITVDFSIVRYSKCDVKNNYSKQLITLTSDDISGSQCIKITHVYYVHSSFGITDSNSSGMPQVNVRNPFVNK